MDNFSKVLQRVVRKWGLVRDSVWIIGTFFFWQFCQFLFLTCSFLCPFFFFSGTSNRRVWRPRTRTGSTASPSWITTICSWCVFWWWCCPSCCTCCVWGESTTAPCSTTAPPPPSNGWRRAWAPQTSPSPYRPQEPVNQTAGQSLEERAFMTRLFSEGAWGFFKTFFCTTNFTLTSCWPDLNFKIISKGYVCIFRPDIFWINVNTVFVTGQERMAASDHFFCYLLFVGGPLRLPLDL